MMAELHSEAASNLHSLGGSTGMVDPTGGAHFSAVHQQEWTLSSIG